MYGAQAKNSTVGSPIRFENDVEMYGAQAGDIEFYFAKKFENDVEMYGAQAWKCLPGH